ncbi:MAG: (d)CMP kinase [Firmicutes bacterium]|nr:(d)CMP kinase [Bacillota bacterium]
MSEKYFQIAIDGPSGAGKSTVAKAVAKKLGIDYIDTGAMYRALGLKLLRNSIGMDEVEKIKAVLDETEIDICQGDIILDGEVVSGLIRTPEVSMAASACSAHGFVREKLVKAQQKMGESKSVIMDGRDICEVVFPHAEYKYYVTATDEERARRRYKELLEKGEETTFEETLAAIRERDYNDSHRAASPLRQAEDAQLLDTTDMTIEEVVDYICNKVK